MDILLAVERGEFSHIAVRRALGVDSELGARERAFVKRVAEGTIERMITLDFIAERFSSVKVAKMKPPIRAIVRSGIYQLRYMDSVPDSAVVNEAVKLAKKRGLGGLSGFVNGLLRAVAAGMDDITWPDEAAEPTKYLSVRYSMPEWIVERFVADYGRGRTRSILAAYLEDGGTWVRVDLRRTTPEAVGTSLAARGISVVNYKEETAGDGGLSGDGVKAAANVARPYLPYALLLKGTDRLDDLPEFKDGLIYPQNIASMMVAELADPKPGDLVLDVCAAPGGKAIHMAQKMQETGPVTVTDFGWEAPAGQDSAAKCGSGRVIACDVSEAKAALIRENVARCRTPNMEVRIHDALVFDPAFEDAADIVLADLPCSGLGVMGGKTDIRYRTSPERIASLASLQREILAVVSRYVRSGGTLIYSTCTMTRQENQDNAAWFAANHPEFTLEEERVYLPDEGCDGFYISKYGRKQI